MLFLSFCIVILAYVIAITGLTIVFKMIYSLVTEIDTFSNLKRCQQTQVSTRQRTC